MNKISSFAMLIALTLGCSAAASAAPGNHHSTGHRTTLPDRRGPIDPVPPPPPPDGQ